MYKHRRLLPPIHLTIVVDSRWGKKRHKLSTNIVIMLMDSRSCTTKQVHWMGYITTEYLSNRCCVVVENFLMFSRISLITTRLYVCLGMHVDFVIQLFSFFPFFGKRFFRLLCVALYLKREEKRFHMKIKV